MDAFGISRVRGPVGLSVLVGLALLAALSHSRDLAFDDRSCSQEATERENAPVPRTPDGSEVDPVAPREGDSELAAGGSDATDWLPAPESPGLPARFGCAMVYDSARERVVLF